MGWDSVVSTLTNAAPSTVGFGSGVVSGVKGGATSLFDGMVSLGSGALSAVKATGRAAIDPAYREQKMAEAADLARRAADYGGQLYDDPATRREAWDTVQSAVGSIKDKYVAARDAAAAKGQLPEFYGGLVGRGGFEVAGLLVPVTKLGALGKVGAAAEGAADLQKAAKVGEALTTTKAGAAVMECADVSSRARGVAINGATRTVPLGFESDAQFVAASQELQSALKSSGIDDAVVGVRGSSVIGHSPRKGTTFGPRSDIDFFVESAKLTENYSTSKNIPGFVIPKKILPDYPSLQDWSTKWSTILGREVTPGAFLPGTVPDEAAILFK